MAKHFENDISKSAKDIKVWKRKLRDVVRYRGSSSPFDFIIWDGKLFLGIECKEITRKSSSKSLNFDKIKDHQLEGTKFLNTFDNSLGLFLVNFRNINYKEDTKGKGKVFIIKPDKLIDIINRIKQGELKDKFPRNDKSIPLDWFLENTEELDRMKLEEGGYGWNIPQLLKLGDD